MKLQPLNGYVVVKPSKPEDRSAAGIILPDASQDILRGEVLMPSSGAPLECGHRSSSQVTWHTEVLFRAGVGIKVKDGHDELLLIRESDLLATIQK